MKVSAEARQEGEPDVEFICVSKAFGEVLAVDRVDLRIPKGAFVSLLGPSGCGKTTSLRMIAGFEQPTSGTLKIAGENVVGVPAFRRPVNMVFQNYALFPHLPVFDNIAFGLRQRRPKPSRREIATAVDKALEMVRLSGYGSRRTWELSGGQQQRVALARAIVNMPTVLLLDEPLAALDRKLRRDMQIELQNLQTDLGITFVLVTHDQEEALSMSDLVCIMRDGRIVQTGSPRELYDQPVNRYVADFVGKSNFLAGCLDASGEAGTVVVKLDDASTLRGRVNERAPSITRGSRVNVAIRPEVISIAHSAKRLPKTMDRVEEVHIKNRIFLGEHTEYLVSSLALGDLLVLTPKRLEAETGGLAPGEQAFIGWPAEAALVLAEEQQGVKQK